mgnify:CR=1 FL=1
MLTEERFAKILSILESMGSVTVQQLMTELNASESTIRRDLNALDANGQLTKVHGGAILKTMAYSTKDDNVVSRKEKNRDAKNKIAKYAAEQIAPGDFVKRQHHEPSGGVCDKCDQPCEASGRERVYRVSPGWRV